MGETINTYKASSINVEDSLFVAGKSQSFHIDTKNNIKENLILLYIYNLPKRPLHGFKVGYTICKLGETYWHAIMARIRGQEKELALEMALFDSPYEKYGLDREVLFWGICIDEKDDEFKDHPIHRAIIEKLPGIISKEQEWFSGDIVLEDLVDVFLEYRERTSHESHVLYIPRDEQKKCIDSLKKYFAQYPVGYRFLMNCKMRFGKCYTAYKYAEETKKKKILVLTFVPAVEESWQEDLFHIETQYDYFTDSDVKRGSFVLDDNPVKPYVVFLSLQNYLGKDSETKAVKDKIRKLQDITFDLLILDEYHFGAWNERTQETLEELDKDYQNNLKKLKQDITQALSIKALQTICLSGTPFKAIDRGEFSDANTFAYSYFDEQKKKYPNSEHDDFSVVSPDYAQFPDMKIFGYNMANMFGGLSEMLQSDDKILKKKYFSLNGFFRTKKDEDTSSSAEFIYEEEIKYWLEIIKGRSPHGYDFPYMNHEMLMSNKHSLWLMPTINSCIALSSLLGKDPYFCKYGIINLSSPEVGAGFKALQFLKRGIKASEQKGLLGTIAITVNKLTLGVTVKPWTSVFVLKDLSSPEQYFQSIFRIQTPDVVDGEVRKKVGYVYDFNIDRASALLLHYAEKTSQSITKLDVANLIVKYLPIYVNGNMNQPIDVDVFFELASFGYNSKPLSTKVKDISKTTRGLDDQTIADMINDPECCDVIKNVFAHAKFKKNNTTTTPPTSVAGTKSNEAKLGRDIGYAQGLIDYRLYLEIDDGEVQNLFDSKWKKLAQEKCPHDFSDTQQKYFFNGCLKGYESGVNVPIKKLQCGKEEGKKYVDVIRNKLGSNILYIESSKEKILNLVHTFLNDINNIPLEFRKKMYLKWYRDSFRAAVISELKPQVKEGSGTSIEDTQNVLRHILSKVFQFLYISVYRETKFKEVFANADPYVFLSAVGIKKEEFEILNKYHVFQERVLDGYIHEFFVNESLGKKMDVSSDLLRKRYRNSFNWFGYGIDK